MADPIVDNSVAPTTTPTDGPKYNEDVNLLEEDEEESGEAAEGEEDEEGPETTGETEEEESDAETEDTEKEPDVKIPFYRPPISAIKEKYPNFFKDFPELKESYFREMRFTELFPTVEDAKEAVSENEAFTVMSEAALSGDPVPIIDSIEKTDKKALELFSMSFLPALVKKDQALYYQVVTPLFQNLVQTMFKDKDENTQNAALVLAEWIFGDVGDSVARGERSVAKSMALTDEQKKLKEENEQKTTLAFRQSVGRVQDSITKTMESMILKSPSFDPDKTFSPSLRRLGAKEVVAKIMEQLRTDKGHLTVMASRWKRARANGYTTDDESKIVSTYLARAKPLVSSIAGKVSAAMLGTRTKAAKVKGERTEPAPKQNNSGRAGGVNGRVQTKVDYSKMSDVDILNS